MLSRIKIIYIPIILIQFLFSVEMVVKPYLQDATPNSMKILWETNSNSVSQVEWGLQIYLNNLNSLNLVEHK